jgi:hypothetical protein
VRRGLPLLLALAALAGCGHTTSVPRGGTVTVVETEYRLTPQSLSAHPGRVTLVARNLGRLAHNLLVRQDGTNVAVTQPIAPGSSATLAVDLGPGQYTIASGLFDDQALGIYGSLTVGG